MRRAALALTLALLSACDRRTVQAQASAPDPATAPGTMPSVPVGQTRTLVFLGDSLTAGYGVDRDAAFPALIEARL